MAKTKQSLNTILIIVLLAIILTIGASCQQPQQPQQGQQQGQQPPQQGQQPSMLFSDDFNTEETGAIPSKWDIVTKEKLLASVIGTTQANDIYGKVLELKGRLITTKEGAEWKDYTITLDFKIFNAGEHEGPEVMFRAQDSDNYYLFATNTQPTGTNYILYKVINGEKYELKQRAKNERIDDEKWHKLKLNIQGNDFTAEIDSNNVLTTTLDGTYNTGKIGLMSHPFSDIYFDNIAVIGTS